MHSSFLLPYLLFPAFPFDSQSFPLLNFLICSCTLATFPLVFNILIVVNYTVPTLSHIWVWFCWLLCFLRAEVGIWGSFAFLYVLWFLVESLVLCAGQYRLRSVVLMPIHGQASNAGLLEGKVVSLLMSGAGFGFAVAMVTDLAPPVSKFPKALSCA